MGHRARPRRTGSTTTRSSLRPAPPDGSVVRITIEALDGADFQPQGRWYFNGGIGLGTIWPLPSDPGRAHQEVLVSGAYEVQLMVQDKRNTTRGDKFGAGAIYRVRFDLVEKTPVDPGPLPVHEDRRLHARWARSRLHVHRAERARPPALTSSAGPRLTGLPAVAGRRRTSMVFDPVKQRKRADDAAGRPRQDMHLNYEVEPKIPSTGVAPGPYWLMSTRPARPRALSRTDYDLSIEFRRACPPTTSARARSTRRRRRTTTRTTTGDTTYAANDTALSDTVRLVGLLSGDAQLPPARREATSSTASSCRRGSVSPPR